MNNTLVDAGAPASALADRARRLAEERLAALAVPRGALGRLGELSTWLSAVQGTVPSRPPDDVRAVVFAGDHGIAHSGVSAYPREAAAATVRASRRGDADLDDVPAAVRVHKVRRVRGAHGPAGHRSTEPAHSLALLEDPG